MPKFGVDGGNGAYTHLAGMYGYGGHTRGRAYDCMGLGGWGGPRY